MDLMGRTGHNRYCREKFLLLNCPLPTVDLQLIERWQLDSTAPFAGPETAPDNLCGTHRVAIDTLGHPFKPKDVSMSKSTKINPDDFKLIRNDKDLQLVKGISRRTLLKYTGGAIACVSLGSLVTGCGGGQDPIQQYPIDPKVTTTLDRMIKFPIPSAGLSPNGGQALQKYQLNQIQQYDTLGYGAWSFGAPLPIVQRTDLMPDGYSQPTPARITRLLNFFSFSDAHITDKEAPNQMIALQQLPPDVDPYAGGVTGAYAPVMLYSTHVLDAAVQTVNALHAKDPFDFGIALGDACNSTQYNELRWYIDVIDGKVITPSSGAHLGADTVDFQRPYKAAGLNPSIPWYQALGNHDHFFTGSFVVDQELQNSYLSGNIWVIGDALKPDITTWATPPNHYPVLFNVDKLLVNPSPAYYGGCINGASPYGAVIDAGPVGQFATPPVVAADANRRSLLRSEWVHEFFTTSTLPVGHGFNLVDPTQVDGFACYSFLPKSSIPIKVIVLDDTQSETDGSNDIHGHGYLDANRWAWLQAELAAGQAANQLMIIAAHVPIGVSAIGSEMEWWEGESATTAQNRNAVDLAGLVQTLWNTPNLLMWMAGHRHINTVKAFPSPNKATNPEQSFWHVETSSLRDYPQQFRTFEIFLNADYTVSIVTTNVDPSVAEGTPAAMSRKYAIAQWQITQPYSPTNPFINAPNIASVSIPNAPIPPIPVESIDPSRNQDGTTDPTIKYTPVQDVPVVASYNVELFKQLSPEMIAALEAQFPAI